MAQSNRGLLQWPQSILGPRPGLKELNVVCWSLFVIGLIFPLSVFLWVRWKSGAAFSSLLPIDFIYFYGIGYILNHHPVVQLYDYGLQTENVQRYISSFGESQSLGAKSVPAFCGQILQYLCTIFLRACVLPLDGNLFHTFYRRDCFRRESGVAQRSAQGFSHFLLCVCLSSVSLLQPRCWATRNDSCFLNRSRNLSREALHAAPQRVGTVDTVL